MDQKVIVDAIEKQMDALESIFNWIILFTIPVFWAGLQKKEQIEALGMIFTLNQAYYVLFAAYFLTTVQIYLNLQRIGDYLNLLDGENLISGMSKLLYHKWIFNPFIYTGDERRNKVHIFLANGGLIVAWMAGNTALSTLSKFQVWFPGWIHLALFVLVGVSSITSIARVIRIILTKLSLIKSSFFETYDATFWYRRYGAFAGAIVGWLLSVALQLVQALLQ